MRVLGYFFQSQIRGLVCIAKLKNTLICHLVLINLNIRNLEACQLKTKIYLGNLFLIQITETLICSTFICFFSIVEWTRIGYFNRPGMALTPFPSSVGFERTTF